MRSCTESQATRQNEVSSSSNCRTVEDKSEGGSFPTMSDVLPVVGKQPFHETTAQARQRQLNDPAPHMMVTLGIDLDLLRKAAEALGTSKLTLFVPVPIKDTNQKPSEVFVNKPVAVCPAVRSDQAQGISVVMPLSPEHGTAYYNKVREVIAASEKLAAKHAKPLIAKPARQAG